MNRGCLILLVVFLFGSLGFSQVIHPDLEQRLNNDRSEQHIPIIIQMKEKWDMQQVFADVQLRGDRKSVRMQKVEMMKANAEKSQNSFRSAIQSQRSGAVKDAHFFWLINAASMKATPSMIRDLAQRSDIAMIELDRVEVMINPIMEDNRSESAWGVPYIGADEVQEHGHTGAGVTVAVLDTGVDLDHSSFANGQVDTSKSKSYIWWESSADDGHGHGTHCAGTIGGQNGMGVAPGCTIIAIKVLSASGSGSLSGITQGIEYGAEHADVLSMSLGGTDNGTVNSMEQAVATAVNDLGVVFAIAAGNSGPDSNTIGSPACAPECVAVGALADSQGRHTVDGQAHDIAKFSSRGPDNTHGASRPDITAPGVYIFSAWKNGETKAISGTSMATPHVAGVMALMLEVNPNLTPAQIKDIIIATSDEPVVPRAGSENIYGHGLINAHAAVHAAEDAAK